MTHEIECKIQDIQEEINSINSSKAGSREILAFYEGKLKVLEETLQWLQGIMINYCE